MIFSVQADPQFHLGLSDDLTFCILSNRVLISSGTCYEDSGGQGTEATYELAKVHLRSQKKETPYNCVLFKYIIFT